MSVRQVLSLNKDWYFHLGNVENEEAKLFGNAQLIANETNLWQKAGNHGLSKADNPHVTSWRTVDVPHDYALEGAFTSEVAAGVGALRRGQAVYVKHFDLPEEDREKRVHLEFDGVFRDCEVFVNGSFVGRHLSGYTSFGFDISELCDFGATNAVAVQVDASDNELWSYEGAGIYRSVRLVKTALVFVPRWGTFVRTGTEDAPDEVFIETTVCNMTYESVTCRVDHTVYAPGGERVVQLEPVTLELESIGEGVLRQVTRLEAPLVWSVDEPHLYTLETRVLLGDAETDSVETTFGVRYFKFDPETGFHLNGQPLKLKGVCCHQDHACVGVAVPAAVQAWRVQQLKDLGCNALRSSHNPPDPALLDACDRLGMLVIDELRLPGVAPEFLGQLGDLIRRDRNHPSVILWSLGNEEMLIQHKEQGVKTLRRMQHLVKRLDPSRPTTYAMNMNWLAISDIHDKAGFRTDVFGANYRGDRRSEDYDDFHAKYPDWPLIGSETFGGVATRGLFEPDRSQLPVRIDEQWLAQSGDIFPDEKRRYFASAYGQTFAPWGYSLEETWLDCVKRPFMAGTFVWTGFDYRGETFPYDWPSVLSRFGVLDYCGFYKEIAHYLRAWWRPEDPHIFVFPHWNWQGREGELVDVWCYSNCAEVELLLNGKSLGKRAMPENFRLEWQIPFEAGRLEAKGFASGGQVISTYRQTAHAPSRVALIPSRTTMKADGEDCIIIAAQVLDKAGEVHPLADNEISFSVEGPAEILGVGNGNPHSHEPDLSDRRRTFHGLAQVILKATHETGDIALKGEVWQLEPCILRLRSSDALR